MSKIVEYHLSNLSFFASLITAKQKLSTSCQNCFCSPRQFLARNQEGFGYSPRRHGGEGATKRIGNISRQGAKAAKKIPLHPPLTKGERGGFYLIGVRLLKLAESKGSE
jgi:hypothetical protein